MLSFTSYLAGFLMATVVSGCDVGIYEWKSNGFEYIEPPKKPDPPEERDKSCDCESQGSNT